MKTTLTYFRSAIAVTLTGLLAAFLLGLADDGKLSDGLSFLIVGTALAVLEISLSFDNAIVNARTLKHMDEVWRRRFLTWGILIAVVGMRLVFPLAVVAIAAQMGPLQALHLALFDPEVYAHRLEEAHLSIAAFGGAFLMMVAVDYFVDEHKDVDWIGRIECKMRACASARGLEIAIVLIIILSFGAFLPPDRTDRFMIPALAGVLSFWAVRAVGRLLDGRCEGAGEAAVRQGLGAFLYLELLDASFSFDGVVGAFAMTNDLFLIAIGLGIGAIYVRSMTILFVERGTLSQFRYLEHGAFYAVLFLSLVMFLETQIDVSELATGGVGMAVILAALWSSIRHNRRGDEVGEERPF